MNLAEFEITPAFVLRSLFLALAVMCMLLPEQAVAFSNSSESSFVSFSGCADFGNVEQFLPGVRAKQTSVKSFSSATELRAAFTPCEDNDRDSDPQYNICFEGNPAPISTLPHLLAGLQAEQASSLVRNTAAVFLNSHPMKSHEKERSYPVKSVLAGSGRGVPSPDRGATCSTSGDQCSTLPGLPGSIELASGVPVLLPHAWIRTTMPSFLSEVELEQELWARLRVGPASGHGLLIERPPIEN